MQDLVVRLQAIKPDANNTVYISSGSYYGFDPNDKMKLRQYSMAEIIRLAQDIWGPNAVTDNKSMAQHIILPFVKNIRTRKGRHIVWPFVLLLHRKKASLASPNLANILKREPTSKQIDDMTKNRVMKLLQEHNLWPKDPKTKPWVQDPDDGFMKARLVPVDEKSVADPNMSPLPLETHRKTSRRSRKSHKPRKPSRKSRKPSRKD